jgi:hypothetical protein
MLRPIEAVAWVASAGSSVFAQFARVRRSFLLKCAESHSAFFTACNAVGMPCYGTGSGCGVSTSNLRVLAAAAAPQLCLKSGLATGPPQ